MRATSIVQRSDGGIGVQVKLLIKNSAKGCVEAWQTNGMATNYACNDMQQAGLLPEKFGRRAFQGWGTIACETAEEAQQVSAEIDDLVETVDRQLHLERAARVMEYVKALAIAGKQLYIRGSNGRFEKIS